MNSRVATLSFCGNKNCFLKIPQSWASAISSDTVKWIFYLHTPIIIAHQRNNLPCRLYIGCTSQSVFHSFTLSGLHWNGGMETLSIKQSTGISPATFLASSQYFFVFPTPSPPPPNTGSPYPATVLVSSSNKPSTLM